MTDKSLLEEVTLKAQSWIDGNYDDATKAEVKSMMDAEDKTLLIDSFYRDLEFGTGGLRGKMGAGSNRMNVYTSGAATQGLSNYLLKEFASLDQISVVIGHDCRNNSRLYAEKSADIFSANGIKVYLFEDLRPTPEISYAIRELGCQSGIIITASHNPKEYNGYKAYWDDGSQIITPHDKNIIAEVNKINSIDDIKFKGNKDLIELLGEDMDEKYLNELKTIQLSRDAVEKYHDLKIIYTPIHGTGVRIIPDALRKFGFTNIINIPEQDVVSGDFPTVVSPNPEESAAMKMALDKAQKIDADIVMASDPDSDRLGIGMKNDKGEWFLVNGNQTALMITYYLITKWKESGRLTGNQYFVKTIVTSELLKEVAEANDVESYDCYTGFKWIAAYMREFEGKKEFICGGEESYGFLCEDFVRDKDAVSACAVFADMTAWAKDKGKTLFELLQDIYMEYGYSKEKMVYVVREGKSGADEINAMMDKFQKNPPKTLAGSEVTIVKDYNVLTAFNSDGTKDSLDFPGASNVLQWLSADGSKISVRPSGTEPKIKFYFEVKVDLPSREAYHETDKKAAAKIDAIVKELGLD